MVGYLTVTISCSNSQRNSAWTSMRSLGDVGALSHVSELGRTRVHVVGRRVSTGYRTRQNTVESSMCCCSTRSEEQLPWEVLDVSPCASEKDIKKAHRRLVLQHHPDRHQSGDESHKRTIQKRFMKIQEAYEMLMGKRHGDVLGAKTEQNGWNFHDFFWSFNYHRRKREERMGVSSTPPPPPAGAWKGQMENLKRRAAVRRWRKKPVKGDQGGEARSNIMNGGKQMVGDEGGHHHVDGQLAGLKRRAALKKTILETKE